MNPDVKKLWVDALRSGEYKQAAGKLRHYEDGGADGYCCLGVLCELAIAAGVPVTRELKSDLGYYTYDSHLGLPSEQVRQWAGIQDPDWEVNGEPLTWHNDIRGLDFQQIAQLIEDYL